MSHPTLAILDEAPHYTACIAATADLRAVREQWGDLLAAIERPPAAEWPPRECAGFLDQLATEQHPADGDQPRPHPEDRPPLVLRQHPAPLNLDALDAALAVERMLFDLADTLAAAVQRSVRHVPVPNVGTRVVWIEDPADRADPARWHLPTSRDLGPGAAASPGSRAHGLHWAAVWCEGRVIDEDAGDLCAPLPEYLVAEAADVAQRAVDRIERALGRDGRTTTLDRPCPWCGGELVGRTRPGGEPYVTCMTGEACGAPVVLDARRRRIWRGPDLVGLWTALDAADRRAVA